ncbi:hypothetical protein EIB75_03000 [Epilithonimonas vandammei]|uniref:EpsG family protein n=1 Tax=Epilithonimonas vandammei TaxID=2487072 RepID=A0A3G8ZBD2_9FLAO|nr:hypothetical protein [Epilithonimonas vandammei]AZI54290.1 hypothetical protein EIB75_03000 [Epilithonimonas vandammei]
MILDILYIPLFVFLAIQFPKLLVEKNEQAYFPILKNLALYHFLLGIAYFFTTNNGGGDAWGYWRAPKTMSFEKFLEGIRGGEGTEFMMALNYIPTNILGMSFLANTFFFSMLGSFGITYFFLIAARTVPYNKIINGYVLFPLIFFLPNLHFWSAGVGKDTTLFLCIGMFSYGLMKPFQRIPLLVISMLLSIGIRPHITLFLMIGFGLAYVFGGKVSPAQRFIFSVAMIGIGLAILPSVMEFAKIEEASAEGFDKFAAGKAAVLSRSSAGSAIDISSYPFPLKVLTFWFRPALFDVRNINGLIAALENLLLLIVFIKAMRTSPIRAFKAAPFVIKGLVIFLVVGTLAFSQSLGNMGIMIRMRNMFLPGMIIYLMWIFSYEQQLLRNRRTTLKK